MLLLCILAGDLQSCSSDAQPAHGAGDLELHVNPTDGNDSAEGRTPEQPLRSIAEAQHRARIAARAGAARVDVVLAACRYFN
eukprot:SAG22_NODE_12392_length_444_cov_1.052174_1_plen_81_part_10